MVVARVEWDKAQKGLALGERPVSGAALDNCAPLGACHLISAVTPGTKTRKSNQQAMVMVTLCSARPQWPESKVGISTSLHLGKAGSDR